MLAIILAGGASCASCSPLGDISTTETSRLNPTEKTEPETSTPQFVPGAILDCAPIMAAENVIVNGSFDEGNNGWIVDSSGTGATWREHSLIGTKPSFLTYKGAWAARLGGYEGSSDTLGQQIFIPVDAKLQYWWSIAQPRPVSQLTVSLTQLDRSDATILLVHRNEEAEEGWKQDCIDLSVYSGREYILEFHVLNDNYTMTAFYIDEVFLGNAQGLR